MGQFNLIVVHILFIMNKKTESRIKIQNYSFRFWRAIFSNDVIGSAYVILLMSYSQPSPALHSLNASLPYERKARALGYNHSVSLNQSASRSPKLNCDSGRCNPTLALRARRVKKRLASGELTWLYDI